MSGSSARTTAPGSPPKTASCTPRKIPITSAPRGRIYLIVYRKQKITFVIYRKSLESLCIRRSKHNTKLRRGNKNAS
ncbi:unnamed protein product [Leptidea sinapis]|uniref:Uncharacterized protein n=1 Tax=Leptidea sinapis TaxID=189913 RepID=A0A5E4Q6U9_9NEOP|nr:unnamed protein product [Leptidea sinapis]